MLAGIVLKTRRCSQCKQSKSIEKFYKNYKRKSYQAWCKECANDPEMAKTRWLYHYYRLRFDDIDRMLAEQNYRCYGCKVFIGDCWTVDHDHSCCDSQRSCGKCIRGLLCTPCNKILAFAKDKSQTLKNLAESLERSQRYGRFKES